MKLTRALNVCPTELAYNATPACLSTTDWWTNTSIPLSNKITITKRRATTVFNRYDYTILDVNLLDTWERINYTRDDFQPIFDAVFTVPIEDQGWNISTQCDFLIRTWKYFSGRINSTESQGADEGLSKLRSLFTAPLLVFNNVNYQNGGPIPDDLGKNISLANVSYRVPCAFVLLLMQRSLSHCN